MIPLDETEAFYPWEPFMVRRVTSVVLAATIALVGCGSDGQVASEAPTGSNRPTATTPSEQEQNTTSTESAAPTSSSTAPSSSAAPVNPMFGQTYTYENGLAVTVGTPQPYTPSSGVYVSEPAPPTFVAFDVTIVNGTQTNYEPSQFSTSMRSGNTEQQRVFDSANGITTPVTPILPGRESVFMIAFGAANPNDLVMQLSPGFEYDPVIFTS